MDVETWASTSRPVSCSLTKLEHEKDIRRTISGGDFETWLSMNRRQNGFQ